MLFSFTKKKLKENRVVFFYSFTISLNGFQQTDLICGIVVHKNFENAELCAFFTSSAGLGDEGADGWWLLVDSCTSYSAASSLFPIGFFLNTTLLIPVKRTASQPTLSSAVVFFAFFLPPFRCKLSITEMIFFSIYIYKKFFRCDLIFIFLVILRWCGSILYLLARVLTSNWQFFYLLHLTFIFIDEMFYDLALSLARSLSLVHILIKYLYVCEYFA